jgi:hypothetical protein
VVKIRSERLVDVDPALPGIQAIALEGTPPKLKMQVMPRSQRLVVSATGAFFDAGGLEVVDLAALRSLGLVVREADGEVGADLGAFLMLDDDRGYLVFSTDLLLSSHLKRFTVSGGVEPGPELHVGLDYAIPALVRDAPTDTLFVPDAGFNASGIHVFDASTGTRLTTSASATAGPPSDLVLAGKAPRLP